MSDMAPCIRKLSVLRNTAVSTSRFSKTRVSLIFAVLEV